MTLSRPAHLLRYALLLAAVLIARPLPTVAAEEVVQATPQAIRPASVAFEPATLPVAVEPAPMPAVSQPSMPEQPTPSAQRTGSRAERGDAAVLSGMLAKFVGGRSLDATLSAAVMFGVASLAPAVLLMTTCFVRMSIVLTLVRQGLGTPQLPSNQILTSLALFLSALVMWPVWTAAYRDGVEPYQQGRIELSAAYEQGTLPIRRWMATQIEQSGNRDTMLYFLARHPSAPKRVATYDDVPVETLLPAFLVSELKTAFESDASARWDHISEVCGSKLCLMRCHPFSSLRVLRSRRNRKLLQSWPCACMTSSGTSCGEPSRDEACDDPSEPSSQP